MAKTMSRLMDPNTTISSWLTAESVHFGRAHGGW